MLVFLFVDLWVVKLQIVVVVKEESHEYCGESLFVASEEQSLLLVFSGMECAIYLYLTVSTFLFYFF